MSEKLVSVIIPVYNDEPFLSPCLTSIINQSYSNIEVICINDGSTDKSMSVLDEFKKKDSRIKVFVQKNKGASSARNLGLSRAKGEYILFVDGDDWIELDTVKHLLDNAISNNSEVVLFNSIEQGIESTKIRRYPIYVNEDFNNFTFDYSINKNLVLNSFMVIWSKFYKKSFLDDNEILFKGRIFNDNIFHVKTMLCASRMSFLPETLYNYRKENQHSLQNTTAGTKKSLVKFKIFDEIKKLLKLYNKYDELYINFQEFKIRESKNRFELINPNLKEKTFNIIKDIFYQMNLDMLTLSQLPNNLKDFYLMVTFSNFEDSLLNDLLSERITLLDNSISLNKNILENVDNNVKNMDMFINSQKSEILMENETLKNNNSKLIEEKKQSFIELSEIKEEKENLNNDLLKLEEKLLNIEKELYTTHNSCNEKEKNLDEIQKSYEDLKNEKNILENEYNETKEKLTIISKQIDDKDDEIKYLKNLVNNLKRDNEGLTKILDEYN